MGQRLDRPSVGGTTSNPAAPNTVATSLSTTFSSSSASSTSSTSSNTPTATTTTNTASLVNMPRNTTSNSSSHRHHRHRHHRSRGQSVPETNQIASTTSTTSTSASGEMSPRTRFRTEMARRGYTNTSSDLFFRLFQFPPQTQAQAASVSAPVTANIEALPATTSTNSTSSSGTGLSAFRFFNLGGGSNNTTNTGDLDSDLSSDEDEPHWNHNMSSLAHSLPLFFGIRDFKCFVCSKQIPADDVEAHIMMCLTKPRLTYNDDILTDNKGECIICFEELEKGQTIARLQCLCIYHKHCIESWLQRSQSCPGHPPD